MLRLSVNLNKITENFDRIRALCDAHGIELATVAKLCLTNLDIVKPIIDAGAHLIAESNLVNLANLPYNVRRMLLRTSLDDIAAGLDHCDYVFISELRLLSALQDTPRGREVGVYVSVEAGDLREGVIAEELAAFLSAARRIGSGPRIVGFAANYGCLRGFVPSAADIRRFREGCDAAASAAGLGEYTVSVGGTTVYELLEAGELDGAVDQIRIGEALYFGYNMSLGKRICGLHDDALVLTGEVIEVKDKYVDGKEGRGFNAFGHKTETLERGVRRRAVLNFGELAAPSRSLDPLVPGAFFSGATHDYSVLDVTDCERTVRVGDRLDFRTNYNSAAQAILSPYVEKAVIWEGGNLREEAACQ